MGEKQIIAAVEEEVKNKLAHDGTGHDFWHIERVRKVALHIGKEENADFFVVELAALLHDIADWKFYEGDDSVGPKIAREILLKYNVPETIIDQVCDIIANISFKGAGVPTPMQTIEGQVVQDADRLDALGAIGIARAFAYGGYRGRPLYDSAQKPVMHDDKDSYIQNQGTTINHFYEKLLLLKDRVHTKTAKEIAKNRHRFMEEYLDRFLKEWDGEL